MSITACLWRRSPGRAPAAEFLAGTIEDCRTIVPPLSQDKGCCTFRVGDGVDSFGDFTSIQAAVNALPAEGGEVCILPGRYFEHVRIVKARRRHSRLRLADARRLAHRRRDWRRRPQRLRAGDQSDRRRIYDRRVRAHRVALVRVEAADNEAGILVDGIGTVDCDDRASTNAAVIQQRGVIDVGLRNLVITAATLPAILAGRSKRCIACNRVAMKNVPSLWPAIYTSGHEIHIEHNWVGIQTAVTIREWLPITVVGDLGVRP